MEASGLTPEQELEQLRAERDAAIKERDQAQADAAAKAERAQIRDDAGLREPEVPKVEHAPETLEEVQALAKAFAEYRSEVAALRNELAAHRRRQPVAQVDQETVEQRTNKRLALIAEHSHYCIGCGALGKYPQKCEGPAGQPHPPLEMVSTEELAGDPANHTAAPSTDPDFPDELAA